jgi:opacity protein-like surface antigen
MSKSIRAISLVLAAAAILAAPLAQASTTTPLISRETYTVGTGDLLARFSSEPALYRGDASSDRWTLGMGANYFINDIFAPGAEFNLSAGGGTIAQVLVNCRAYWPGLNRFLPYALIGIGYMRFPGANLIDFAIGPGFDFMLSNTAAIGLAFRYDLAAGDGTFHKIGFPLGFSLYFKI